MCFDRYKLWSLLLKFIEAFHADILIDQRFGRTVLHFLLTCERRAMSLTFLEQHTLNKFVVERRGRCEVLQVLGQGCCGIFV